MKAALLTSLVVVLGATAAYADPAPRAPDFGTELPQRGVDRSLALSDARTPIAPSDSVVFWPGSAELAPAAVTQLDAAARWLRRHPGYKIAVEGHAELGGSPEAQQDLATRRAHAVRAHLMSWGIPADRILVLVSGAPDARVELFASTRPIAEIAAASIDHRRAIAAVWTVKGARIEEQAGLGTPRRPAAVATRR